ncbi:MAG TPA: STAS domain-containing protein, partial [Opitutaceae bacterium]|nr:STAS domain-containing protein [Opitutaceae bacterium]
MPNDPATAATLRIEENPEVCRLHVGGRWSLAAPRTHWRPPEEAGYRRVEVRSENLERWDAALVLFLAEVRRTCDQRGWTLVPQELPPGIPAELFATKAEKSGDGKHRWPLLTHLG